MQNEKPSFYGIIPANVRYCRGLIPNAKLLYSEITALADKTGYCYANNAYFSNLYEVTEKQISVWIMNLIDNGFIDCEIKKNDGNKRYISLKNGVGTYPPKGGYLPTKRWGPYPPKGGYLPTKRWGPYPPKGGDPTHQKVGYINTSINTSIISFDEEEIINDIIYSIDEAKRFINFGILGEKFPWKNLENSLIDWWLFSEEKGRKIRKSTAQMSFSRWLSGGKPEKIEEEKKNFEESKRKRVYKNIDPASEKERDLKEKSLKIEDWKIKNPKILKSIEDSSKEEAYSIAKGKDLIFKPIFRSIVNKKIGIIIDNQKI